MDNAIYEAINDVRGTKVYVRKSGVYNSRTRAGNITGRSSKGLKTALVFGAGGFIGSHLTKRLINRGYWVCGVDLKYPEFSKTEADDFFIGNLTDIKFMEFVLSDYFYDEIYQLAADMGGAGYVFTGENDLNIMENSALINLNLIKTVSNLLSKDLHYASPKWIPTIFYSSSACVYPKYNQETENSPNCREDSAYPADPDSEYGWEKLFSERLYIAFQKKMGVPVRIARFHNIFGPEGVYDGGREKAPAALCRKVAASAGEIEIWGDGQQTRSFLYIDECLDGIEKLMNNVHETGPFNIGSDEMITIDGLAKMISAIADKRITIKHIDGPLGVRGRNSDNTAVKKYLGWEPTQPLYIGMEKTYDWINRQINKMLFGLSETQPMTKVSGVQFELDFKK